MLRNRLARVAALCAALFVLAGGAIGGLAAPVQAAEGTPPGPSITLVSRDDQGITVELDPPSSWTNAGGMYDVDWYNLEFTESPSLHPDAARFSFEPDDQATGHVRFVARLDIGTGNKDVLDPAKTWYIHANAVLTDGTSSSWSSLPDYVWGVPPGTDPPPDPGPADPLAIKAVDIDRATPSPQLKWPVKFTPVNPSVSTMRYEYTWSTTPDGTEPMKLQKCQAGAKCMLNVGPTDNGKTWNLLARLVDASGAKGPWFKKPVELPKSIPVVVLGDSIQAGHHRDGEGLDTLCHDSLYAMGYSVFSDLRASAPVQWQDAFAYINLAESGFGLKEMIEGGTDACGRTHISPLEVAEAILQGNRGSWALVLVDGSINSTNWGTILEAILGNRGKIKKAADCQGYVSKWNLSSDEALRQRISNDAEAIIARIRSANSSARLVWTGYYNVAGTGSTIGGIRIEIPRVCKVPFDKGRKLLEGLVRPHVESHGGAWAALDPEIGGRDELLQELYASDLDSRFGTKPGWPHLNELGVAIARGVVLRKT